MPCYQTNALPPLASLASLAGRLTYTAEADCNNACQEGACCEPNGACSVKPQCQCQGTGQTFRGVGTTCAPNPCCCGTGCAGVDCGACCEGPPESRTCSVKPQSLCQGVGKVFLGAGTQCTQGICCEPTRDTITLTIVGVSASDENTCKFPGLFESMPGTYVLSKPPYGDITPGNGEISGRCSRGYHYSGSGFSVFIQAIPGTPAVYITLEANASPFCGGSDLILGSNGESFIFKQDGKSRWPEISAGAMTSPTRTERLYARVFFQGFRLEIGSIDLVVSG